MAAAIVRRATATPEGEGRNWRERARAVDVFDVKADVIALLTALGAPVDKMEIKQEAPSWYHPGRSGSLCLGPNVIGVFGEPHPALKARLKLEGPYALAEVVLDHLPLPKAKAQKSKGAAPLLPLQPVRRDFAFLVSKKVRSSDVVKAIASADKALISRVDVFDLYEGKGVPEGQVSMALSVTLQPQRETLTDAALEALSTRVVDSVSRATGGVLRA
jgi:phenylalanyl-tRNA synthetase beta chain